MLRIAIDPGHGGHDPGAVGPTELRESVIALDTALKTGALLDVHGHEVLLTRYEDRFLGLSERADMANEWGADLFISIHCNSFHDPSANGTEVWYYDGSRQGKQLAQVMQRHLVHRLGRRDRGIKSNTTFTVLRRTTMPSVLVELAFISNPGEETLLSHDGCRALAATAIYDAVREWSLKK